MSTIQQRACNTDFDYNRVIPQFPASVCNACSYSGLHSTQILASASDFTSYPVLVFPHACCLSWLWRACCQQWNTAHMPHYNNWCGETAEKRKHPACNSPEPLHPTQQVRAGVLSLLKLLPCNSSHFHSSRLYSATNSCPSSWCTLLCSQGAKDMVLHSDRFPSCAGDNRTLHKESSLRQAKQTGLQLWERVPHNSGDSVT